MAMKKLKQNEYKAAARAFAEGFATTPVYAEILAGQEKAVDTLERFFADYLLGSKGFELYSTDGGFFAMYTQNSFVEGYLSEPEACFDALERYMILDAYYQKDFAVLDLMAVDPAKRGQGIGSKMIDFFVARCNELGVTPLVEIFDSATRPLYERHGFTVTHSKITDGIETLVLEYKK